MRQKPEQDGKQYEDADRKCAACEESKRPDSARVDRHSEDRVRIECEKEQYAREHEPRMVLVEIFAAKEDEREKEEERPRCADIRGSSVENDEAAPETSERELCRDGEDGAPSRGRYAARRPCLDPMEKRDGYETDGGIGSEDHVRLPEIDAPEEETVGNESCEHGKRRKMPLAVLDEKKDLPYHGGAWTRARTGDPFLFREVLYQLSYPSSVGLLPSFEGVYQLLQICGSRETEGA